MIADPLHELPAGVFERRRRAVFEALAEDVMLLPAAAVQYTSRDTERRYCPDRELYYLTGVDEPEAVAVLVGGTNPSFALFVRERDPDAELWAGPRLGPEGSKERYGADHAFALSELSDRLPEMLAGAARIHFRSGRGGRIERVVVGAMERSRARGPRTGTGPRAVVDPGGILDELRLIKDEYEVDRVRRACDVTVLGHLEGAAKIVPGAGEWAIEAAIEGAFRSAGATGPGFPTIAGSGPNACVLHYVENSRVVERGDLVLIDAGAEVAMYHGDVTRTYPAGGKFTARQRDVYEVVEAALKAAVGAAGPGVDIVAVHDAATRVLTQGLIDFGILEGAVDDRIEEGAHKAFFPHQTSHWLGLDVHDPGDYASGGDSRELVPGMVLTVEPGLYFRDGAELGNGGEFDGIGIRIEDDVLITLSGPEVLTASLPRSASEIEALLEKSG